MTKVGICTLHVESEDGTESFHSHSESFVLATRPNHLNADLEGFPVILINGPPRAGKDTAAEAICRANIGARLMRFSGALKSTTHAMFGLPIASTHYESTKDQPLADFHGMTPRAAYIAVSEQAIKPTFGRDFFGRVLVSKIRRERANGARMAVVPDSGFDYEAEPVVNAVGLHSVLLIRVNRPGRDFSNDSRGCINLFGVEVVDLPNNGTIEDFQDTATQLVRSFIWRKG